MAAMKEEILAKLKEISNTDNKEILVDLYKLMLAHKKSGTLPNPLHLYKDEDELEGKADSNTKSDNISNTVGDQRNILFEWMEWDRTNSHTVVKTMKSYIAKYEESNANRESFSTEKLELDSDIDARLQSIYTVFYLMVQLDESVLENDLKLELNLIINFLPTLLTQEGDKRYQKDEKIEFDGLIKQEESEKDGLSHDELLNDLSEFEKDFNSNLELLFSENQEEEKITTVTQPNVNKNQNSDDDDDVDVDLKKILELLENNFMHQEEANQAHTEEEGEEEGEETYALNQIKGTNIGDKIESLLNYFYENKDQTANIATIEHPNNEVYGTVENPLNKVEGCVDNTISAKIGSNIIEPNLPPTISSYCNESTENPTNIATTAVETLLSEVQKFVEGIAEKKGKRWMGCFCFFGDTRHRPAIVTLDSNIGEIRRKEYDNPSEKLKIIGEALKTYQKELEKKRGSTQRHEDALRKFIIEKLPPDIKEKENKSNNLELIQLLIDSFDKSKQKMTVFRTLNN